MTNKDAKILITGATGFVGKNLYKYLKEKKYTNLVPVGHNDCELINPNWTAQFFIDTKPDIVIHLAAKCGGIGANRAAPAEFWHDNLMMGVNVLNCSVQQKSTLIMLGTTCSYPKFCKPPFKESDLFNGYPEETNAPYGIVKRTLLTGAKAYHEQYGLDFTYLVPTNLYGPSDKSHLETSHVIPAMFRKFIEAKNSKNEKVMLWGDGTPTRDFLYVEDLCEAISMAIERPSFNDAINIGTGEQISMSQLSTVISDIVGYNGSTMWDTSKPNGQPIRALDILKAKVVLGWEPRTKLWDGLKKTYEFYKINL